VEPDSTGQRRACQRAARAQDDVSDAAWLCQMGECGLLKASFVPPEPIRHLRDLTRYRTTLATERTREMQRL
jgi:transposase